MSSTYRSFAEIAEDNHVLIHVLPEDNKGNSRIWQQYIHDLDYFFTKVYKYHQKSGFTCIVVNQVLQLIEFIFIVVFTLFLIHFVDYNVLFKNKIPPHNASDSAKEVSSSYKVTIADCLLPLSSAQFSGVEIIVLIIAVIFWILKAFKFIQSTIVYLAIKSFYTDVLRINDCSQYSWQDVQSLLIQSQHLCMIQDGQLTELDIHNRILRHRNYMIALLNKRLLPIHFNLPLIGEYTYFSNGLQFNVELLLFKGPFAVFENNWKLREEIKAASHRTVCAQSLSKYCFILGCVNLVLVPVAALWQLLHTFYAYTEILKRDPSQILGARTWSLYAKLHCRHFNELDHQLSERLNKGYKAATKYMSSFTSPLMEIIAKHFAFVAGAMLSVLLLLTIYDEDVITIEHMITVMTGLGAVLAISRGFLPSDTPVKQTRAELNMNILEHIHYTPHGYAPHSPQACKAMSSLFQYRVTKIFEELISPLVTPFILLRHLQPRALEIVDFFRTFTVEVHGTGDVCTFAMMNIKDNGNPAWLGKKAEERHFVIKPTGLDKSVETVPVPENLVTADGKLELSLINFKLANPKWKPYDENQKKFIDYVYSNAMTNNEAMNESNSESVNAGTSVPRTPYSSLAERSEEAITISRERSRIIKEKVLEEPEEDASLAMSLSTLYMYEHALKPMQDSSKLSVQHCEKDPLLLSRASTRRHDRT